MQLGSDVQIRDGLLAENTLLREKPRLGFERTETTVHQASIRLNYLNGNRVSSTVVFEGRPVSLMAQQQSQTPPPNANMNVVLSAGFPPQANHTEGNGAFFEVQWDALKLDSKGAVIPHYNPQTGLYSSTPAGDIKLIENQGSGFTDKYSATHDHGSTVDTLIAGHAPLQQRWTVGGQPVRVVIGGTASKPILAWTVQVTMSPRGPVYSAAP